jgi:membrane protease YdiL (CAAX protease family)
MFKRLAVTVLVFIGTLAAAFVGVFLALAVLLGVHGGGALDNTPLEPFVGPAGLSVILIAPFWVAHRTWKNYDQK